MLWYHFNSTWTTHIYNHGFVFATFNDVTSWGGATTPINDIIEANLWKELTSSLSWLLDRRILQGQAHGTVCSLTVLPVRYDLTRRGTVRIWEEREGRRVEGGGGIPVQNLHCCINIKHVILGHMEKQEMEKEIENGNWKLETGNGTKEYTNHWCNVFFRDSWVVYFVITLLFYSAVILYESWALSVLLNCACDYVFSVIDSTLVATSVAI